MKCTLMHKRLGVVELELDDETGFIKKIVKVHVPEHLPVGIAYRKGIADRAALNAWWMDRSIPASRSGIQDALEYLNVADTKILLVRCFGLSLSDQYWIRPEGTDLTWDHINFFDNAFSDDMGDVLFGKPRQGKDFDFSSPDNTSDGCLKKRWKILNGKRILMKGGSNPFRQQPFNEVIASRIAERLGISHVRYELLWENGAPYSVCEDFVTAETELVSAWRIMQTQKKDNSVSVYRHFVNCCNALGAGDVISALDRMIVLDYLIANEDRHLNNFGLLRNAETLEWLGMAPIFDSGSSLGFDKVTAQIRSEREIGCKPFKKRHEEQLKLVSAFGWIDFQALANAETDIRQVLSDKKAKEFMEESRITAIAESVGKRTNALESMAQESKATYDSTEDDVEENIAEDYIPKL